MTSAVKGITMPGANCHPTYLRATMAAAVFTVHSAAAHRNSTPVSCCMGLIHLSARSVLNTLFSHSTAQAPMVIRPVKDN